MQNLVLIGVVELVCKKPLNMERGVLKSIYKGINLTPNLISLNEIS